MMKVEKPDILVWGGGSQSRILMEMLKELGFGQVAAVYDPFLEAPSFETHVSFINKATELKKMLPGLSASVVGIGDKHGRARVQTARCLAHLGLASLSLRHHKSFFDPTSTVKCGLQMMPGAIVHKFCTLGEHVIVNTNAVIDHETVIGNGCHIMGSAAIAGRVRLGNYVTVGTNATILPDITVGDGAYIGAGAVVTANVPEQSVIVGVPGRKIKDVPNYPQDYGLTDILKMS